MQENIHQPKVLVIVASTRPGRVGRAIADWFYAQVTRQQSGVQFELVDLVDWDLPMLDEPIPAKAHMYQHDHTKKWSAKVAEADGYIIVTPEYNHGYSASLKNALDYLYQEWAGKPVAFVGYGMGGGQLAVQQLHQVVDYLQMQPLPEQVAIVFEHDMFDEHHQLVDPDRTLAKYTNITQELARAMIAHLNLNKKEKVNETA
jgi:NAD(P)H-dependent FMN reductase